MLLVLCSVSAYSVYAHENNVPSCLSQKWLCGKSCPWAHEVRLHIAGTSEPKITTLCIRGKIYIYIYKNNKNIIYIFIPSKMLTFSDVTILQHLSKLRLMSVG